MRSPTFFIAFCMQPIVDRLAFTSIDRFSECDFATGEAVDFCESSQKASFACFLLSFANGIFSGSFALGDSFFAGTGIVNIDPQLGHFPFFPADSGFIESCLPHLHFITKSDIASLELERIPLNLVFE